MEAVDNNSDHVKVLDAAITYKINGTYLSNSSKDRNAWLHQRIHAATDFLSITKCMYPCMVCTHGFMYAFYIASYNIAI